MNIHDINNRLQNELAGLYDEREAASIADWVMEKITGWKKVDRVVNKQVALSSGQKEQLAKYTSELLQYRPVQYVLEEAWFMGLRLLVNEDVLIPRPETEELAEWILTDNAPGAVPKRILDIGTGSGCIPIALKKNRPEADVYACDVSREALALAATNARLNNADILFMHCDVLDDLSATSLPYADLIVSNPPYIPVSNQSSMQRNVLDFEPSLALFVSNDDPLLFYKKIADIAAKRLNKGGGVYLEIHEEAGGSVTGLLKEKGFNTIELRKDMQGKDRMIKAVY